MKNMTFFMKNIAFFIKKYVFLSKNMTFLLKKYARKIRYFQNLEKKAPAAGVAGREAQR